MIIAPRKPLFSSGYQLDILICLGLLLAIFIPYRQVAGHSFVNYDDGLYAYQNTYLIRGLSWDGICWAFTNISAANWHPLTWISHLVDRELFGPHAGGYLLENVAWHALASCLCYVAFRRTTGSRLFGFVVALFFAVHPANVENVAWASERKSILNAVFWFSAIIAYLDFIEKRSFRAYGVVVIAHLLGLMCKAMSVTLPCTLVLIHALYLVYHPDRRGTSLALRPFLRRVVPPVLPMLALSVYFSAVTISAQSVAIMNIGYTIGQRVTNALLSYERYIEMFFHPNRLAIFYPLFEKELTLRSAIPSAVILSAISIAALVLIRKKPQLFIGWCWFLGTLIPVIGLVQVGSQSHADRYLYIPMLGLAFVYPVLFEALRSTRFSVRQSMTGMTLVILGISMILATRIQVSYWEDGVALFGHSLAVTGDCVTTTIDLAVAYVRAERYQEAIAYTDSKIAVATNPANKGRLSAIQASAFRSMEKYESAIASAQKAIDWGDTSPSPAWSLAISNYMLGKMDEATRWLAKAQAAHPSVEEWNYIARRADANMANLKRLLQEKAAGKEGLPSDTSVEPAHPGDKNRASANQGLTR